MKYIIISITITIFLSLSSQAQSINKFYSPKKESSFPKFNDFKTVPLQNYSIIRSKQEAGVPPALLIIGGAGLFILGAATEPQGSGYGQVLLMAGGIGLATTGVVIAVSNNQNDWE